MHKQKLTSYILLFIITIGTTSLLGIINISKFKSRNKNELLMSGRNILIKQFDNKGNIKYKLNAISFQDITPQKTIIKDPNSVFYDSNQKEAWKIKGDKGYIHNQHNKKLETISLNDNVILTKITQHKNPISLKTNKLDFFTNNEIAYTDYPVLITEKNTKNQTTANGLIYSSYLKKLYLLNNVKTYYEPKTNKNKNSSANPGD